MISQRSMIGLVLFSLGIMGGTPNTTNPLPSQDALAQMNVVFIVADDLGTEVGFMGDTCARTPHLDSLAQRSVIFRNAYVTSSSCSPSRSSIYSGTYPHTHGQTGLVEL